VGDPVIVLTYAEMEREELLRHVPTVVLVDEKNRIRPPERAPSPAGRR
jgi:aspartate 1-decarboxylase